MTREARRSRRRWRRLRRDLPHVTTAADETAPDFILTHAGVTAVSVEPELEPVVPPSP